MLTRLRRGVRRRRGLLRGRRRQGDAAATARDPDGRAPAQGADRDRRATCCPQASRRLPRIHLMHRRPDIYPEPARFRPERFLEQPAGTYTWIPFGGGVRRCLGASFALFEMRVVLSTLAARLHLRPADAARRAPRPAHADHPRALSRGAQWSSSRATTHAHHRRRVSARRLTRGERQAQTRARIMDAATRVFSTKGLERGSIEDVVDRRRLHQGRLLRQLREQAGPVPRDARGAFCPPHRRDRAGVVRRRIAARADPRLHGRLRARASAQSPLPRGCCSSSRCTPCVTSAFARRWWLGSPFCANASSRSTGGEPSSTA